MAPLATSRLHRLHRARAVGARPMRCTLGRERKPICERPTHARRREGSVAAAGDGAGRGGVGRAAGGRRRRRRAPPCPSALAVDATGPGPGARTARTARRQSSGAASLPHFHRGPDHSRKGRRGRPPLPSVRPAPPSPPIGTTGAAGRTNTQRGPDVATQQAPRQASVPSRAHAGAARGKQRGSLLPGFGKSSPPSARPPPPLALKRCQRRHGTGRAPRSSQWRRARGQQNCRWSTGPFATSACSGT